MDIPCTYLLELDDNNTLSYIYNFGDLQLFDKSIISNESNMIIVRMGEDNLMNLYQFDTNLTPVDETSHELNEIGRHWIFSLIEFEDNYVVASYNYVTSCANSSSLHWFDINDLSLKGNFTIEENELTLQELTIDPNGNLNVIRQKDDQRSVLQFNSQMEQINEMDITPDGDIGYLNFEILSNGDYIIGLHESKTLLSYDDLGKLNWEVNIAQVFEVSNISFIRELKKTTNGDILLCGTLRKDNEDFGFIISVDSNGQLLWHRKYTSEGSTGKNALIGFVELVNSDIIFYGNTRFASPPLSNSFPDTHWILKTNNLRCISEECEEDPILNTSDINNESLNLFPNPTSGLFKIKNAQDFDGFNYKIINMTGKVLKEGLIDGNYIDLSDHENAMYFLKVFKQGKLKFTKKVIKQ